MQIHLLFEERETQFVDQDPYRCQYQDNRPPAPTDPPQLVAFFLLLLFLPDFALGVKITFTLIKLSLHVRFSFD